MSKLGLMTILGLAYMVFWGVIRMLLPFIVISSELVLMVSFAVFMFILGKRIPFKLLHSDRWALPFVGLLSLILLAYFQAFPIFPNHPSDDFVAHVRYIEDYLKVPPDIQTGILYTGIHSILTVFVWLGNGDPLVLTREGMGYLVALSPFAVYYASSRLVGESQKTQWKNPALFAMLFYILSGIWFSFVFNSGLFPNFYAVVFAAPALLAFVKDYSNWKRDLPIYVLLMVNFAFSHYSALLILPILLGYMTIKRMFVPLGLTLALGGTGIFLFNGLFGALLAFLGGGGAPIYASTFLSGLFSFWPALGFMFAETGNDVALVLMFLVSVLAFEKRKPWLLLGWLVVIIAVAPLNVAAWRFSMMALFPLMLIGGAAISDLMPKDAPIGRQLAAVSVTFLVVWAPMVGSGWSLNAVTETLDYSPSYQADLVKAIHWLADNQTKRVISVSDWRLTYSPLFSGPEIIYAPRYGIAVSDPFQVSLFAARLNIKYLIVTAQTTENIPISYQVGSRVIPLSPWLTFSPLSLSCSSNCTIYQNDSVKVFQIAR